MSCDSRQRWSHSATSCGARRGAESTVQVMSAETTRTVQIDDGCGGAVTFTLRMPRVPEGARLPVVILLVGIKTDGETLTYVPQYGGNAFIAYHYDYDKSNGRSLSNIGGAWTCHRMTREVSGQIATLVEWVKSQSWADPERVNLVGGSLGAIVLPMILRDLMTRGIEVRTVTFAYGGAGRVTLGYLSVRRRSWLVAVLAGALAGLFLRRLEPAIHLPHIRGEFFIISSPDDKLVPRRCSRLFEDLTPEPKSVVHVTGEHLGGSANHVLRNVVDITIGWLIERDAINP